MDRKSRPSRYHGGYLGTPAAEQLCEFEEVRTDLQTGRTVARYDRESVSPGIAVPTLIAQREDVDPVSLPPMYDCVDVDALERVIGERAGHSVTVRFRYAGYTVSIDAERLAVQSTDGEPPAAP